MQKMVRVLVGCECSGIVREAFRRKGHAAWSCDLKDSEDNSDYHIMADLIKVINANMHQIDLLICHPPCTFITVSGNRWLEDPRYPNRKSDRLEGIAFAEALWNCGIKHIAMENPIGGLSTETKDDRWWDKRIGKPNQIIQPWQFGESYQKSTCLWLKNLPLLMPTEIVDKGEFVETKEGKRMPKWYSDAKSNDLEKTRTIRSRTSVGIANAMADQWGKYISELDTIGSLFLR